MTVKEKTQEGKKRYENSEWYSDLDCLLQNTLFGQLVTPNEV